MISVCNYIYWARPPHGSRFVPAEAMLNHGAAVASIYNMLASSVAIGPTRLSGVPALGDEIPRWRGVRTTPRSRRNFCMRDVKLRGRTSVDGRLHGQEHAITSIQNDGPALG